MAFRDVLNSVAGFLRADDGKTSLSRRDMLSGIGMVGALAVAGPLLIPRAAGAVELLDAASDVDGEITLAGHRRGRNYHRWPDRGRGRRRRHGRIRRRGRRRTRPRFHAEFHFSPAPRYTPRYAPRRYAGRCDYWARMCTRNWGYGNPNFRGCMRYHGCW